MSLNGPTADIKALFLFGAGAFFNCHMFRFRIAVELLRGVPNLLG